MIELVPKWIEPGRLSAIQASTQRLLDEMTPASGPACVWCLLDVVWPGLARKDLASATSTRIEVALVPLSRLGQMEGQSGSYVLFARLRAPAAARPSNMLVVKTRDKAGTGVTLSEEWKAALAAKPHTFDRKDSFAIPLYFDDKDPGFEVLWSLCLPAERESESDHAEFDDFHRVEDLRSLLAFQPSKTSGELAADEVKAQQAIRKTYKLLRNLHRAAGATGSRDLPREKRTFGTEYDRYLRGYDCGGKGRWGTEWGDVWAPPTERRLHGTINPLWVIERVKTMRTSMQLGIVHGDLHAGNVILRDDDAPAVIDFGWSAERAHVSRDFVLMECNLRFVTLRPQIADADLENFAATLAWQPDPPPTFAGYLNARWELIKLVRDAARGVFADDTDWSREYLVPLFLVAFGLLRFARQLGNQRAAVLLVERLATLLSSDKKLPELHG